VCRRSLDAGTEAAWDSTRRTVTCTACLDGTSVVAAGVAGGSARSEAMRRRAAQEERLQREREHAPVIARIGQALWPEPDAGGSWAKGAVGEEAFGAALDKMTADASSPLLLLHDRRVPASRANIDHLAVTPTGVWVIDAKRYAGRVTTVDRGTWRRADTRLLVNGRDRTKLVDGVISQAARVGDALAHAGLDHPVPVHGALCFVDADRAMFAKPKVIRGVTVSWGKALRARLVAAGPIGCAQRTAIHHALARSFPPAG
jgi:hypothetical protein